MTENMSTIRRRVGQKVANMSPLEASRTLDEYRKYPVGVGNPVIQRITNGYSSQSINDYVKRKLAERAGLIGKS